LQPFIRSDNFTTVDNAKKENQDESVTHMEEFMRKRDELFDQVGLLKRHFENDIID
ncbi:hypothetical protein JTB14_022368, partial [Gonioctena quinquepunctata]